MLDAAHPASAAAVLGRPSDAAAGELRRVISAPQLSKSPTTLLSSTAASSQMLKTTAGAQGEPKEPPLSHAMKKRLPAIKLEVMPLSMLRLLFFVVWLLNILCVLVSLAFTLLSFYIGLSNYQDTVELIRNNSLEAFVTVLVYYTIDGTIRTIGSSVLFWIVLSFPQRIIIDSIRHKRFPLAEQVIIILVALAMSILPAYSIYGVISFWIRYIVAVSRSGQDVSMLLVSVIDTTNYISKAALSFNAYMTIVVLCLVYLYVGGISFFQAHAHGWDVEGLLLPGVTAPAGTGEADADEPLEHLGSARKYGMTATPNSEERTIALAKPTSQADANAFPLMCGCCHRPATADGSETEPDVLSCGDCAADLALCQTTNGVMCCLRVKSASDSVMPPACTRCWESVVRGIKEAKAATYNALCVVVPDQVPIIFILCLTVYLIISVILVHAYDFAPSQIPFVSIITVIRVCLTPASSYRATSVLLNDGFNVTFLSIVTDANQNISVCQADNLVFNRAASQFFLGLFDVFLIVFIARLAGLSRDHLVSLPYAATRGRQLGFTVFRSVSWCTALAIMSAAIVCVCMVPVQDWTVKSIVPFGQNGQPNDTLAPSDIVGFYLTWSPLHVTGISPFFTGWAPFLCMCVLWLTTMAVAYLPTDSYGLKGWWTANAQDKDFGQGEYLVYVAAESDVPSVVVEQARAKRKQQRKQARVMKDVKRGMALFGGGKKSMATGQVLGATNASNAPNEVPALVQQVENNLLVLETEVLLYQFMHIAYDIAARDSRTGEPLSLEDQAALIQDKRFRLVEHLHNETSDTHCVVAASSDRIVVSFRGSVSLANWKTNWDSHLIEHPLGKQVEPLISEDLVHQARARHVASYPALVHGGFVKAYSSISDRLSQLVRELRAEVPHRVVFITGHSLGGGLATVCAFDLGVRLELPKGEISLTTWGCPKVGTFAFTSRVSRVVPNARRFVMTGDIIVPLPIDPPFNSWTMLGWYHVGTEIMLDRTGNMLVRPSPVERALLGATLASPSEHVKLTYCGALMVWSVRSHSDEYGPDWWVVVVNDFMSKSPQVRLKEVAPNIRQRLMEDLVKPGTIYELDQKRVRDFAVGTEPAIEGLEDLYRQCSAGVDQSTFANLIAVWLEQRRQQEEAPVDEASFVSAASDEENGAAPGGNGGDDSAALV